MKVLLVAPPILDYVGEELKPIGMDAVKQCPPYGVYLLAAILRTAGHEVTVADLVALGTASLAEFSVALEGAALVGTGVTSLS
jgi:anaerobic magnesium-protoporphyrin IX monomethyl ester cyclase